MTLAFVDPAETTTTYRVLLWAAPGEGKTVAACSAPGPILALSADRPTAFKFARTQFPDKDIRETRYTGPESLEAVYKYLSSPDGNDIKTVIVDPFTNVIDQLADRAPAAKDGGTDYQWVNSKALGFVKALRRFDVNLVLVAHEKINDGKRGDGKTYPAVGGPALINKVLAEMDVVAHVERHVSHSDEGEERVQWAAQLQPARDLVCKESTGALGDRRILDLTRWFELASAAYAEPQS